MSSKISSDKVAATDAISKVVDLNSQPLTNDSVSMSFSNVKSMSNAVGLSNQIISDMSKLVGCTFKQADKIQALASLIERRDAQDGASWQ